MLRRPPYDLAARPFLVIWEVTRACELACRHCRAEAIPQPLPDELTTEEGFRLLEVVASFGRPPPLLVLTGGDPFLRTDLIELVERATTLGLPVSVSPSGTPNLDEPNLEAIRAAGAVGLSLSIDGSTGGLHDGFRGVDGTFDATLDAWRVARRLGFRLQINTTVTPHNLHDLPEILGLVRELGATTWSVFFLVPTGRGRHLHQLTAQKFEDVLHFLYEAGRAVSVKATEAHHFRRVVIERGLLESLGVRAADVLPLGPTYHELRARAAAGALAGIDLDGPHPVRRPPLDVASGRGFVFVSATGAISPSGFLPLPAGNVRRRSLVDVYRSSPLFEALRDPERLTGRCGRCEFARVCGGSRSRAYGATGDPLAEEPACAYEPGSFPYPDALAAALG